MHCLVSDLRQTEMDVNSPVEAGDLCLTVTQDLVGGQRMPVSGQRRIDDTGHASHRGLGFYHGDVGGAEFEVDGLLGPTYTPNHDAFTGVGRAREEYIMGLVHCDEDNCGG